MVLAVIDDLMLRSRVSAAAKASGTDVRFASGDAEVLLRLTETPTLIILDLNSRRADPVALVARLKADRTLSGVRVLGFVSHVDTATIEAARSAGIDAVLARGAFVTHLPRILAGEDLPPGPDVVMTLAHVLVARQRIQPFVHRTPLVHSPWLSAHTGANVRLKLETLQVTNSFKARGAVNAAVARTERRAGDPKRDNLLVTASAGNHGRALAYASERMGLHLVVFTPADAPRAKLDHIARHGADLRAVAPTYEDAERLAKDFAAQGRITYISPYSHPDVIAGAATVALEIIEDWPSVEAIVVPVGGGGLISGVAVATKAISTRIEVIGVEAEASPAFHTSLAAGRISVVDVKATIADGLAGNMDPETITFDFVRRLADRVVIASEHAIEEAVRSLVTHDHLIAEGAGATGVAGLMSGLRPRGMNVAVVVSGSNIDTTRLTGLMAGGGQCAGSD